MRKFTTTMLFVFCVCSLIFPPRVAFAAQSDRRQAEKEIRQMIYDLGYAQKTGDVETVKKLTARRALELYRFAFNTLVAKVVVPATLSGGTPTDSSKLPESDEAFLFILRLASEATSQTTTPEELRAMARAEAERPITFIDDRKACIYGSEKEATAVFAVFEDGRWKMDDTEMVKAALLSMDNPESPGSPLFTLEQKERIKKF